MHSILLVIAIYSIAIWFSPFPYWSTYRLLWRHVLFDRAQQIGLRTRLRQAWLLIRHLILVPVWTLLWHLDEILFPSYRAVKFEPLFIVGQPRCGTTLLHRTLATDEESFFSIRHFEWRFPYLVLLKPLAWLHVDRLFSRIGYWPNTVAGKEAASMHPDRLSDYEEDGIFYEERFLHHYFVYLRFPYPGLLGYLDEFPGLPEAARKKILTTYDLVIHKIAYLRGGKQKIYLSKEVTSHNKIPFLIRQYTNAKFVVIVRHANDYISSLVALVRKSTLVKTGVDPVEIPGWKREIIANMAKNSRYLVHLCVDVMPPERQYRITFNRFTKQIESTVKEIHAWLGIPLSEEVVHHLKLLEEKQQNRKRGYRVDEIHSAGFEEYDQFVDRLSIREETEEQWAKSRLGQNITSHV